MGNSKPVNNSEDLWLDFLKDAPEQEEPTAKDGSEWSGQYDRRASPRASLDLDGHTAGK